MAAARLSAALPAGVNVRAAIVLLLALSAGLACAQELDDEAALSLPGSAPQKAEGPRAWRLFVEGAAGRAVEREPSLAESPRATQRLSVDLLVDAMLAPALRGVLADRLDVDWEHRFGQRNDVNTLKEAYLSWQPRNDVILDLGRINQYSGVAIGQNPTDFFRSGALRSVVSVDPTSIKKNRQGSVMARGQMLWDGASLTALYSPKLAEHASNAPFSPDWGATNFGDRAMLIFSKRLTADLNPQWILYKEAGGSTQAGINLTKLVNDSTVAYVEWSGGRVRPLLSRALGQDDAAVFRNRVSAGLTYTTSDKLSLTIESEYNGAGLDKGKWMALPQLSLPAYVRYRELAQSAQEMPTRRETFFYATWQDVALRHLDMSAMIRRNSEDRSRLSWLELRYRKEHDEIALQWQRNSGNVFSEYGASPSRLAWQILYLHYL
jgi:hypothetical protein